MTDNAFYGWFDDASQHVDQPTYDPPHDGPCLYCGNPITPDDVRTHSLMLTSGYARRSYFYRTHRTCAEVAKAKPSLDFADDTIFGMIARNGD